jgi:hypothetical protein
MSALFAPTTASAVAPTRSLFDRVWAVFEVFAAARSCAAAVEAHRQPDPDALRVIGIDPVQFQRVRLF